MSFPRYPKYKPSGVEWLGDVPEGWEVKPLKHACHVFPSNVDKKSHEGEVPVLLCNYTDVYYNETITAGMDFMEATASTEQIAKFTLRAGDTIITKDSETADDIAIGAYVPADLPGVVCGYHLSMVRPSPGTEGAFLKRLFDSNYAKSCFAVRANGLTRVGLGQYELDNVELPFPPLREQTAIAAFLDRETEKIDGLVAEQQRLMELLKEKRQAVISHAVTKGLNPRAPMKPSGIEWLGDVPEHWAVERGRFLFRKLDTPPEPEDGVVTAFRDGQVTLRENRRTEGFTLAFLEVGYQRVRAGDLVIHGMDAFAGAIGVSESTGKCTPEYSVMTPARPGIDNRYFARILRLMAQRNYIFVICPSVRERAPRFRFEAFKDIPLPVPPLEEQQKIIHLIESVSAETITLAAEAQRAIDLLQERRTALISAAVTGQIDVRNVTDIKTA